MTYQDLQKKHPLFYYQSFSYQFNSQSALVCSFVYQLQNGPQFTHQVIYHQADQQFFEQQESKLLDNLVFHLGLAEMLSYWKLSASPTIAINCGHLSQEQLDFWQQLLIHGLGEYFYVNQIPDFLHQAPVFSIKNNQPGVAATAHQSHSSTVSALGIGGGKDSAVMIDLFQKNHLSFVNLIVEPASPAATKMSHLNKQPTYHVQRFFDAQLFTLNNSGYLNGHVPFSAIFAFISLLAAVIYDFNYIFVGNENSANQSSLKWLDVDINHQFSKSTKFEQDFFTYSKQFLIKNVEYYSLMRPFTELKIAQIFCTNPILFPIFKSCNRFQQKDLWCEVCPKCLFVFLILSPFLDEQILTSQIFSHNLLNDQNLLPTLKELLGLAPVKPLECVGTIEESQLAFYLTLKKYQQEQKPLPALLQQLQHQVLPLCSDWQKREQEILHTLQPHSLPDFAQAIIEKEMTN